VRQCNGYYSHAAIPQPPRLDLIRCTQNVLDVECRPPYQFHSRPGVIRVVPHDDAVGGGCGGGGGAAHDEHVDEEEELRTVLVSRGEGGRPFRIRGLANDLGSSDIICYIWTMRRGVVHGASTGTTPPLTSVSSTRSPTSPPPLRTLPTLTPSSSTKPAFGDGGGGGTGDGSP